MALIPDPRHRIEGLISIYQHMIQSPDFPQEYKIISDLIEKAMEDFWPYYLQENEGALKKLDQACWFCEISTPESEKEKELIDFLLGYGKTLRACIYLYQGQWKEAQKEIKEAQSAAARLAKAEKSPEHLFIQAEIKALFARILFIQKETEKAMKTYSSAIGLYKQALKKSQEPLSEKISLSLQKVSLEFAEICQGQEAYEKAFEFYDLSYNCLEKFGEDSLYITLLFLCREKLEKDLFSQLNTDMSPKDLLPEEKKEEYSYEEMEEALLAARLQALFCVENPDFYTVLSFFAVLYLLLEYWYRKVPEEDRMPDSDLIVLCQLFDTYLDSEEYTLLFRDEWDKEEIVQEEESEELQKIRQDLGDLPQAFMALAEAIQNKKKIETPNPFHLKPDQTSVVLEKLYKYYEKHMFQSKPGVLSEESDEYLFYPIDAYLYLVALINYNNQENFYKAYNASFFDLCWSIEGGYYYNEDFESGYFYIKRALDCLGKQDPYKYFGTYRDILDFYTDVYNCCFGTGHDEEGYKYRRKVDRLKEELYDSGFYDQDDWMFR